MEHPSQFLRAHEITWLLANQLSAVTRFTGLQTVQGLALRINDSETVIPGVVIRRPGRATEATLVADVVSPAVSATDRARQYAEAGIEWYLVAEPDFTLRPSVALHLLRRDGTAYRRHTSARFGQSLTSQQPFPLIISTARLIGTTTLTHAY